MVKNLPANAGDAGSIPRSGRSSMYIIYGETDHQPRLDA